MAERPPPYREFRAASGMPILVGRGSDRNDELTFKVARGNDLWLHARDWAGAHVIVASDGRPVDGETLLDAATLAAHHSRARDEAQVDILYVARKHVRKPPRSAPGLVTTSGAKTVRVRMQPERLQRLLTSRIDDER
jgi:predicted ribosome quality control (RQC) complex YloA/Tae2 family protein